MRPLLVRTMCLALLAVGSMGTARAQNQQHESPPSNGTFISVRRAPINTAHAIGVIIAAESSYRQSHKRFGSWQEVYDSGLLWDVQRTEEDWRKVSFAPGPAAIPGYRLSLLVSADGAAYSISLQDIGSNGCGSSLFSGQNGLIYQGTPIGCLKAVSTPQYIH